MLITLNFIDAKIQETKEMDGRKWRANKSGREGRNLTEKMSKYGSPVICHCLIKSLFKLFVCTTIYYKSELCDDISNN
jgi:hypothetical protein